MEVGGFSPVELSLPQLRTQLLLQPNEFATDRADWSNRRIEDLDLADCEKNPRGRSENAKDTGRPSRKAAR